MSLIWMLCVLILALNFTGILPILFLCFLFWETILSPVQFFYFGILIIMQSFSCSFSNCFCFPFPEYREKTFSRPERIRSSSISIDAVSLDVVKMVCGICQKSLRRKFNHLASSVSCCELSVVAVLVCGHVYHADCLEQRTSLEEQRDPPCPMCAGLLLQVHDSKGQEWFPSRWVLQHDVDHHLQVTGQSFVEDNKMKDIRSFCCKWTVIARIKIL